MEYLGTYTYNDEVFKVFLTRKRMKNIRYRLRDDSFYISAPYLASKSSINKGLVKFAPKLISNRKPKPEGDGYIYLYGCMHEISESGILELFDDKIIKYRSKEDLERKLKKHFLSVVTNRVRYYEELMKLEPHNVRVRKMHSRYGSNSKGTRTVSFAFMLIHYSIEILDAIVVHELAHSIHFDHSPKFYDVVYTYCKNYDLLHKKLRNGVFL